MYWFYRFCVLTLELHRDHRDAYPTWLEAMAGAARIVRTAKEIVVSVKCQLHNHS